MITLFSKLDGGQRRLIRTVYLVLIVFLAGFAFFTYRQLQAVRNSPVHLPNYWFYIVDTPGKGSLIQANGSWVVTEGAAPAGQLQTSTIECQQAKMMCMESTAVVSVREGSFLESFPRAYEIESWTDKEVLTKPSTTECSAYTLRIDLVERTAYTVVTGVPGISECKDRPRKLKLDNGSKTNVAPAAKTAT